MHKPWHSLVFGIVIFLLLSVIGFTFPKNGFEINKDLKFSFPKLSSLLGINSEKKDIEKILQAVDAIDTSFTIIEEEKKSNDTIEKIEMEDVINDSNSITKVPVSQIKNTDTDITLITNIQARNKNVLKKFFTALHELKNNPKSIRILHYGDSQIEGDRITDYLRLKLQGQFGGNGPGLISLMPISNSLINRVTTSDGWDRYNVFTGKDKRVPHGNYGILAGFTRFIGYKRTGDTNSVLSSSVSITTTKLGGENAMTYKKLKLFYGAAKKRTWCEFYDGPALMAADSLDTGGLMRVKEYKVGNGSFTHTLKFRGKTSPDFYALSLESDNGVMVDNIALRGSSGTFFHLTNNSQLKQFYEYLNVKLIILQFGGNSLPAIENDDMAVNYSNYIKYQISLIKKMAPEASIIFIGPSDMSIKNGTEYITYPYLETMRDALRKVVLESDCAFFDMYDCMGGKNSMPEWVEKKLAATDYTHFSPQGARKIATLFYSELIKEYNAYLKTRN
ncbi:GDSL-type esterase/lipase family protein [Aurantibacillus circumpalustris]|uniref:GDSL-type esterase/lipase family protein n=1 Tax=Aurantibacillus circumpalustris TaxID=3036359 RepID=UPI00295B47BF|nr:GDSL-type esterase/lipase family protein [Aurantibacillus circumpalustris]